MATRCQDDPATGQPDLTFDPHDPRHVEEGIPFAKLARIRAETPVCRTAGGAWYLSRYEDVAAALTDVATFRADLGPITGLPGGVETIPAEQHYLSEIEEPRHKAIRRLIAAALSTTRLNQIEPVLVAECGRMIDAMLAVPVADLHDAYAMAIPALAMSRIMALEEEDAQRFMDWSWDGTLMQRPATPGVGAEGPASHSFFHAYLARQRAMAVPSNDLMAQFLGAVVEGAALTDAEIVTQLHFMIQAGVHTTRALLAHLFNRLVQDAALWARLQADRSLVPLFIEESLRRDSPVQRTTRRCTRDTVVRDVAMRAGDWVEMGIGSANHDEAMYDAPGDFRLGRTEPKRHLAFGAGSHVCPGAALARMEARVAVTALLDRVARLETVAGASYPPMPGSLGHQPIPARLIAR